MVNSKWSGRTARTKHRCHEDFMTDPVKMNSCFDLESAYKQCPVHPEHLSSSILAVKMPTTEEVEFFIARALPFGAKSSVHGFNRASRALNYLQHEYAGVRPERISTTSPWWPRNA